MKHPCRVFVIKISTFEFMKHLYLLSFLFVLNLNAQITLEHVHIIATGRAYTQATDNTKRPLASSGANQIWDYSNLNASQKDSIRFGMPFWYKGHTNFPSSNHAFISSDDTSTVGFGELTNSAYYSLGNYSSSDTSLFIFKLKMKIFEFPSTYESKFSESLLYPGLALELGFDPDSAGPLPNIDSMRISTAFNRSNNIDGWGTLKLPSGNFNALKSTTLNITSQEVYIKTNNLWIKASGIVLNYFGITLPEPDSVYNIQFMTNSGGIGAPLLSYDHRKRDTTANMTWMYSMPRKSSIRIDESNNQLSIYPNPTNSMLNIDAGNITAEYVISNSIGQIIAKGKYDGFKTINVEAYSKGIYQIQLINSEGQAFQSTKFSVN